MKKAVLAVAMLGAFSAAQATTVGNTAGASLVDVGPTTIGGFHGPLGAPGIGVAGSGQLISLQSIEPFTYIGTVSSGSANFNQYQLPSGFVHPTPGPGTTTVDMNGFKIPGIAQNVYFGLATSGTSSPYQQQSWYVGDQTGFAKPSATTNYDAVAILGTASTSGTAPIILTGVLEYDSGTDILSTPTPLIDSGSTHELVLTSNVISTSNPFGGTSEYWVSGTQVGTGDLEGRFFSASGSSPTTYSAVAGIAHGTSGVAYEASFGGIEQ